MAKNRWNDKSDALKYAAKFVDVQQDMKVLQVRKNKPVGLKVKGCLDYLTTNHGYVTAWSPK